MKAETSTRTEIPSDEYLIVPKRWMQSIADNQEKILSLLKERNGETASGIGDYISESEAKKLLGRKTTWFWQMRSSGRLAFSKVGNKVFYLKDDILGLINKHHSENTNQGKDKD